MKMKRGLFIVFEGLDRSGKSTQSRKLHEAFKTLNLESELWQYPNRSTAIGQLINKYLKKEIELDDTAVHLLFSANRWETAKTLREKLNSGISLIVDRYAYSGVAYTAAKEGFSLDWCKSCDNGLPKPDLVFFMDSQSETLASRQDFGAERYETTDFQKRVYTNFKKLFNYPNPADNCRIMNAKDTIDGLHDQIVNITKELINSNKMSSDLQQLW